MRRNKSDDKKMNGLAFRQVRNFCKTRPLYEKADNPNARLIRAVALRSGRLRPFVVLCHSERSEESFRYFADAQYDIVCHYEQTLLSF